MDSLKGRAQESVHAFLVIPLIPENVETIMNILEKQFGRTLNIIHSLDQKNKETPSPRDGKPENLIRFTNYWKNLIVTVEHLQQPEYTSNPQPLEDLIQMDPYHQNRLGELTVLHKLMSPSLKDL